MDEENSNSSSSNSSSSSSSNNNSVSDNDSAQQPVDTGPVPDNPASPVNDDEEQEEGEIEDNDNNANGANVSDDDDSDDDDDVLPPGMTAGQVAAPTALNSGTVPGAGGGGMFHPLANLRAMDNRLLTLKETAATRPPTPPELKKEEPCDSSDGAIDSDDDNVPVEVPQTVSPTDAECDGAANSLLAAATPVSPGGLDDSFGDGLGSSDGGEGARKRRSDEGMTLKDELDFEEGDERESGEEGELGEVCGTGDTSIPDKEEGEISEEEEDSSLLQNEPKTVCRFFNKGQCTWGTNCRFLHPGVSDKGNYNMFAPAGAARVGDTAPPVTLEAKENGVSVAAKGDTLPSTTVAAATVTAAAAATTAAKGTEATAAPTAAAAATTPKKDEVAKKEDKSARPRFIPEPSPFESAWERGLRHAKDLIKRSHKRREMDADFEEKRFNLSLGQAELDRENDYYTRPASPVLKVIPQDPTGFDPYDERQAIRHFRGGYFENFEVRYHVDPSMVRRGGGVAGGGLAPPPGPGGPPTGLPPTGGAPPPRGRDKYIPPVVVDRGDPDEMRGKKKHPDERRYPRSPGSPKSEDERPRRAGSPGAAPMGVGGEDWADPWVRGGDMAGLKRGRGPAPPPPASPPEGGAATRRGRGGVDSKKARKLRSRSYSSGGSRSSRSSSGSSHSSRSRSRSSRSYSRSHSRSASPSTSRRHRSRHRRSGSPMPPGAPPPGHYPHGGPPPPHHRHHPGHRQPGGPPPPHGPPHFDPSANGGGFYPPHEAHYPPQPYFRGGGGFNPNYRGGRGGGMGGPPPHYGGGPPMDQGRYPPNQQFFRGRGRGNFRGNFRGRFPYNHYNNNNNGGNYNNSNYNTHPGGGPPYPGQHHGGPGGYPPGGMNQHGGGRRGGGPDDGRHPPRDPRVDAFGRQIRRSRSAKRRGGGGGGESRSRSRSVSSSSSRSQSPPRSGTKRGGRPPARGGGKRRKYSLSASRSRSRSGSYSRSRSRSVSRSQSRSRSSDSEQARSRGRHKKGGVKGRLGHPNKPPGLIIPTDPRITNLPPTSIGFEARKKLKGSSSSAAAGGKKRKAGRRGRKHSRSVSGSRSGSRSVSGSRSRSYSSSSSSSSSGSSVRGGRRAPNPDDRPRAPINTLAAYTASGPRGPKAPSAAAPLDPSKVAGQKQQIKLTLKPALKQQRLLEEEDSGESDTGGNALSKRRATSPADEMHQLPRKMARGGEAAPPPPTAAAAPAKKSSTASRREELLMQLRAVEDAIAKKRNKLA